MTAAAGLLHQQMTDAQRTTIWSPEQLWIRTDRGISYGAQQAWYTTFKGRIGGCGPTAASNLLWYLAATRPQQLGALFGGDGTSQADMVQLMQTMWRYITPGMRGVDKSSIFVEGSQRYAASRGVTLNARTLEIPNTRRQRPDAQAVYTFLQEAFADNLPAAFLNLSSGALIELDSWHWVTLVSVDEGLQAEMYDQGESVMLDIGLWLHTTTRGGAFVVLSPDNQ